MNRRLTFVVFAICVLASTASCKKEVSKNPTNKGGVGFSVSGDSTDMRTPFSRSENSDCKIGVQASANPEIIADVKPLQTPAAQTPNPEPFQETPLPKTTEFIEIGEFTA